MIAQECTLCIPVSGPGVSVRAARQITIVACDPATLARDLAGLVAAGYRVEGMTLVDLFPQTYHLETVVRLKLG